MSVACSHPIHNNDPTPPSPRHLPDYFTDVFAAELFHRAGTLLERLQQRHAAAEPAELELITLADFEAGRMLALFGFAAFGRTDRSGIYRIALIEHGRKEAD